MLKVYSQHSVLKSRVRIKKNLLKQVDKKFQDLKLKLFSIYLPSNYDLDVFQELKIYT